MHPTHSKQFLELPAPQMCFGDRNVLRTLSKVPNPRLGSQRDCVSADGAAFTRRPAVPGSHDIWSAGMRVWHRLHSHSITVCSLSCIPAIWFVSTWQFSEVWDQEGEDFCRDAARKKLFLVPNSFKICKHHSLKHTTVYSEMQVKLL